MDLLDAAIASKLAKGPSGGDVTPASVANAVANMNDSQKEATRRSLSVPNDHDGELYGSVSIYQNEDPTAHIPADEIILSVESSDHASVLLIEGDQSQAVIFRGIAEPLAGTDAVNLKYVDEHCVGPDNARVHDALTILDSSADDDDEGVYLTAYYNDGAPFLEIAGTTGDEFCRLTNVAAPINSHDAANKEYVDGRQINVSETAPTITPISNAVYNCGELTSLTISNPPATGKYTIKFVSGATPTAAIIPPKPAMRWQTDDNEPPQGFPAANIRYEINVDDTYVVLSEWPVPGVSA